MTNEQRMNAKHHLLAIKQHTEALLDILDADDGVSAMGGGTGNGPPELGGGG